MSEIIDIGSENLPDADFIFNGSIFQVEEELYIAYRVNNTLLDAKIYISKLDKKTLQPVGKPKKLDIPNTTTTAMAVWEDPRVFWCNGKLYCSYVFLRAGYSAQAQGLVRLNKDFEVSTVWFLKYGYNHNQATIDPRREMDPRGFIHTYNPGQIFEKNWSFFEHQKRMMFIYKSHPHTVVETDLAHDTIVKEYRAKKKIPWRYGEIRGGTSPLLYKDKYITFFHSSVQKTQDLKIYYAGAYAFDNKPPFKPIELTRKPLLVGDVKDLNRGLWNNVVVFPCGAVNLGEYWVVSYGHNDYCLKLLKIANKDLEKELTKI